MMQRVLFVLIISLVCLSAQVLCQKVLGDGLVPSFMMIAVVFFNLYRGMNMSLGAAFWGGFLLDSFSGSVWGINVLTLGMCAYLTGILKMYIYQPGVAESRVFVVCVIAVVYAFGQYFINVAFGVDLKLQEAFIRVILPEVILTTFVANFTLERFKECALKLFA